MNIAAVLKLYREGFFARAEVVYRLALTAADSDTETFETTMREMPDDLRVRLEEYVRIYDPETAISICGAPSVPPESLERLRKWFGENS